MRDTPNQAKKYLHDLGLNRYTMPGTNQCFLDADDVAQVVEILLAKAAGLELTSKTVAAGLYARENDIEHAIRNLSEIDGVRDYVELVGRGDVDEWTTELAAMVSEAQRICLGLSKPRSRREQVEDWINELENSFGISSYRDGQISIALEKARAELATLVPA